MTLTLERQHDAARLNIIANHPSVLPFVTLPGQDSLDLTPLVANPRNIALASDEGGFIGIWHEPGVFEIHTMFLPEVRGASAAQAVRDVIHIAFQQTEAMELLTKVPTRNLRAEAMTRRAGFHLDFERPDAWVWRGERIPLRYYALRYPDYVNHYAADLEVHGHWFHEVLEAKGAPLGIATNHPDDPVHDRHVGAAVQMIRAGQIAKAVMLYNRWARFAGYETMRVASTDPLVLNLGQGILIQPTGNSFEVLRCQ